MNSNLRVYIICLYNVNSYQFVNNLSYIIHTISLISSFQKTERQNIIHHLILMLSLEVKFKL